MSSGEKLVCPVTNNPCMYPSYCGSKKEMLDEGGIHPLSSYGISLVPVPRVVLEANDSSYCSIQRIEALEGLAADEAVSREVQDAAWLRGLAIAVDRAHFK